jgi:hypothetical protein
MDTAGVIYEDSDRITRKLKKSLFTGTTEQAISQPRLYLSAFAASWEIIACIT